VAKFLRDYQRAGVEWLYKKYHANTGGILGDCMGLGKTVQTAALLIAVLNKSCTVSDVVKSTKARRRAEASSAASSSAFAALLKPSSSFTGRERRAREEVAQTVRREKGEGEGEGGGGVGEVGTAKTEEQEGEEKEKEEEEEEEEEVIHEEHDGVEAEKEDKPTEEGKEGGGGVGGGGEKGPVLIVCPSSLVQQWKAELLTWAHFEVAACEGKQKEEVLSAIETGALEVMICSYTCYQQAHKRLNVIDWEVILNEKSHL
jgi:hypothetical protein